MTVQNFQPIVTKAGRAADQASKLAGGAQVLFANILFGDGGGAAVTPADTQTALVNQVCSVPVDKVYLDTTDPTIVWIEGGWGPATPRGFTIRELALQLASGALYAVAAVPETYMPLATQGVSRTPRFKIPIIETNDGGLVQLIDNPGQWATEQWVVDVLTPVLSELLRAAARSRADLQVHGRHLDAIERRTGRLERAVGWARAVLDQLGVNTFRVNTTPTPDP